MPTAESPGQPCYRVPKSLYRVLERGTDARCSVASPTPSSAAIERKESPCARSEASLAACTTTRCRPSRLVPQRPRFEVLKMFPFTNDGKKAGASSLIFPEDGEIVCSRCLLGIGRTDTMSDNQRVLSFSHFEALSAPSARRRS